MAGFFPPSSADFTPPASTKCKIQSLPAAPAAGADLTLETLRETGMINLGCRQDCRRSLTLLKVKFSTSPPAGWSANWRFFSLSGAAETDKTESSDVPDWKRSTVPFKSMSCRWRRLPRETPQSHP